MVNCTDLLEGTENKRGQARSSLVGRVFNVRAREEIQRVVVILSS